VLLEDLPGLSALEVQRGVAEVRDTVLLSLDAVAAIVERLGATFAELHAVGIYHLDLSPTNVLVRFADDAFEEVVEVCVLDFGTSYVEGVSRPNQHRAATPGFLATHYVLGQDAVGPAIPAEMLAKFAWYLLTMRTPRSPLRSIRTLRGEVSPALDALVLNAADQPDATGGDPALAFARSFVQLVREAKDPQFVTNREQVGRDAVARHDEHAAVRAAEELEHRFAVERDPTAALAAARIRFALSSTTETGTNRARAGSSIAAVAAAGLARELQLRDTDGAMLEGLHHYVLDAANDEFGLAPRWVEDQVGHLWASWAGNQLERRRRAYEVTGWGDDPDGAARQDAARRAAATAAARDEARRARLASLRQVGEEVLARGRRADERAVGALRRWSARERTGTVRGPVRAVLVVALLGAVVAVAGLRLALWPDGGLDGADLLAPVLLAAAPAVVLSRTGGLRPVALTVLGLVVVAAATGQGPGAQMAAVVAAGALLAVAGLRWCLGAALAREDGAAPRSARFAHRATALVAVANLAALVALPTGLAEAWPAAARATSAWVPSGYQPEQWGRDVTLLGPDGVRTVHVGLETPRQPAHSAYRRAFTRLAGGVTVTAGAVALLPGPGGTGDLWMRVRFASPPGRVASLEGLSALVAVTDEVVWPEGTTMVALPSSEPGQPVVVAAVPTPAWEAVAPDDFPFFPWDDVDGTTPDLVLRVPVPAPGASAEARLLGFALVDDDGLVTIPSGEWPDALRWLGPGLSPGPVVADPNQVRAAALSG
jgi:hypothetical protein